MPDHLDSPGKLPSDEMSEYLQTFLDETEEQLDDLVETLLVLEREPANRNELNDAFRLIHSIKGSAGMMGFDRIALLTHHLENRFERFRSGADQLDQSTMNLVLRCVDYLREGNERLRSGGAPPAAGELLEELKALEQGGMPRSGEPGRGAEGPPEETSGPGPQPAEELAPVGTAVALADEDVFCVRVSFESGLQLVDLKAQLIASRLSGLGTIKSTQPPMGDLEGLENIPHFEVVIETAQAPEDLRKGADVDGVQSVEIEIHHEAEPVPAPADGAEEEDLQEDAADEEDQEPALTPTQTETPTTPTTAPAGEEAPSPERAEPAQAAVQHPAPPARPAAGADPTKESAKAKVSETLRVDIDRLDNLMNLAGELVVNRARFVQVSRQLAPALKKTKLISRFREFVDSLRRTIENLQQLRETEEDWTAQIQDLESGLQLMEEHTEVWDESRRCFGHITEAIDQLTRVSDSLQRGVLETRMVPVGPLFNRFKRVVRDLSVERGKKVRLEIRGEQTELDKRMIDELGDPLVHLVRNAMDHGLELPEVRTERGKPGTGTILLEASHSGNHVIVRISDDGRGIAVEKVKAKIIEKDLLPVDAVAELSDDEAIGYIWHPGFSTAKEITDVSGRGVGMDVVKNRLADLNGTIEVTSVPGEGSTFTIRLPLTLAIIHSLLVRMRQVTFAMPISDVREIVSVKAEEIVAIQKKRTFEVRGTFIPLVGIDDVFEWHDAPGGLGDTGGNGKPPRESSPEGVNVVILQAGGKTMGLQVDELLGGQEIVIKSLSDNFISIPGVSGASILGDGTVCLMLDVSGTIDMAATPHRNPDTYRERQLGSVR